MSLIRDGGSRWSRTELQKAWQEYKKGISWASLGKKFGTSGDAVRCAVKRAGFGEDQESSNGAGLAQSKEQFQVDDHDGGNGKHILSVSTQVKTVQDALDKGKVNLEEWAVERSVVNSWECAMKIETSTGSESKIVQLWQVKVWLKRKLPKLLTDALEGYLGRIREAAPVLKLPPRPKTPTEPCMLEVSIFDIHFGKLAWDRETGNNYDVRIAEEIYSNAVQDLLKVTGSFNISKILLPVGQDFFHVNNAELTTTLGTKQDVDGRWARVFQTGCRAVQNAIRQCLEVAPVEVLFVPGNHDTHTSWYLVNVVEAYFHNTKEVKVDTQPMPRKYVHFGQNLIGFTHGNEEKHRDLPNLMASEVPDLWARSCCREWHLGHFHKAKQMDFVSLDTYGSVRVRVLPSLSGTDAWHFSKGYTSGLRAAEAYLWGQDQGYVGHFSTNVRSILGV